MKNILLLILILLSVFSGIAQTDEPITVPTIAIKAPLAQAVALEHVTVTLLDIKEDSRCPDHTTCVWEGRAIVKVELLYPDGTKKIKELEFRGPSTHTLVKNENDSLIAVGLYPYPDANIPKEEWPPYALLLQKG